MSDDNQPLEELREQLRSVRPEAAPVSAEAIDRARGRLSALITEDETTPVPTPLPRRRSLHRRITASVLLAAAVLGAALVGHQLVTEPDTTTAVRVTAHQTPTQALHAAGLLLASAPTKGTGAVRHIRFRNFSDPGTPVYDLYLDAEGAGTVATDEQPPSPVSDYLTRRELENLPTDPVSLRPAMLRLAQDQGLTQPDEDPARGLLRLGVDLLTDPATPPTTRRAVYEVLASIDSGSVEVSNIGRTADLEGRPGIGLRFAFPEGAVQTLVIDAKTGALLSDSTTLDGLAFSGQAYLLGELVQESPATTAA